LTQLLLSWFENESENLKHNLSNKKENSTQKSNHLQRAHIKKFLFILQFSAISIRLFCKKMAAKAKTIAAVLASGVAGVAGIVLYKYVSSNSHS
jgi:hypothetical protein